MTATLAPSWAEPVWDLDVPQDKPAAPTEVCVCVPEVTVYTAGGDLVVHAYCTCGYSKAVPVSSAAALSARVMVARERLSRHDCGASGFGGCFACALPSAFARVEA